MFYHLAQLLKICISPVSWIFLLLIVSIVIKKRRWKLTCRIVAAVLFLVCSNKLLYLNCERAIGEAYAEPTMVRGKAYEAAIVMGGFASMDTIHGNLTYESRRAGRLWEAVRLYRTGCVKRILITGDESIFKYSGGESTAQAFLTYMAQQGVPDSVFLLEQKALNTHENVVFSKQLLAEHGIPLENCLLITSALHMRRSLSAFKKAGAALDYYASDTTPKLTHLKVNDFYPRWKYVQEWQYLLNEIVGQWVYSIVGYG